VDDLNEQAASNAAATGNRMENNNDSSSNDYYHHQHQHHHHHLPDIEEEKKDPGTMDGDPLASLFVGGVDPTPLEEIHKRDEGRDQHQQQQQQQHYHYGRLYQLPIPTQNVSPPQSPSPTRTAAENKVLADALATAAAIVTTTAATRAVPTAAGPYTTAQLPAASSNTNTTTTAQKPHSSIPSIQHAAKQKAQYGFGGNHVVPSIPRPPLSKNQKASCAKRSSSCKSAALSSAGIYSTSTVAMSNTSASSSDSRQHGQQRPPSPTFSTTESQASNQVGAKVAYERKKQRAKDARVRLNDSIDRLGIAINLAGSQSSQRIQQFQPADPSNSSSRQTAVLQIMQDCVQTADTAKKWDRPSFVGSAALLVQGLNAQCETLMREVLALQEQLGKAGGGAAAGVANRNHTVALVPPPRAAAVAMETRVSPDKRPAPFSCQAESGPTASIPNVEVAAAKRQKMELEHSSSDKVAQCSSLEQKANYGSVDFEPKILNRIACFLDPVSLLRCLQTCKAWKESGTFSGEPSWQNLSLVRFGFFNVRQWRDKVDEDEGVPASAMTLYRSMDYGNVMPHFSHEGMFLLGETRLSGKVSAWTFLVERSNGETLRSVQREASMPGSGMYASLPVVELKTVIQNTGAYDEPIVVRDQIQTVDASTRRRGEEMREIEWDDRFKKRVMRLDGSLLAAQPSHDRCGVLCRLKLFEAAVVESYIYARGCTTASKFVKQSNFTKILVCLGGTTVPLVIPFPRDATGLLQH
jgi:hypothetical protein